MTPHLPVRGFCAVVKKLVSLYKYNLLSATSPSPDDVISAVVVEEHLVTAMVVEGMHRNYLQYSLLVPIDSDSNPLASGDSEPFGESLDTTGALRSDLISHESCMFHVSFSSLDFGCFLTLLAELDGKYWNPPKISRPVRTNAAIQASQLGDQKILTRLTNIIQLTNRMNCAASNCDGTLSFTMYLPNAFCLKAKCSACGGEEKIQTARPFTLNHSDKQRQLPDLPYLEAVSTRLLPGGGFAVHSRIGAILGRPSLGQTCLNAFYQGPFLAAVKAVYAKSINDNLAAVKQHSLLLNVSADGVSTFYPLAMSVDARWDKPWGWNALNATIRMIEPNTDLVMSTVTLHRRDSSEEKFDKSAKSCDSEGSARCLIELTKMGFDVVEVVHDDDSSTFKKLAATKAELAMQPAYKGKISPDIKETLCTRCVSSSILFRSFFSLSFLHSVGCLVLERAAISHS